MITTFPYANRLHPELSAKNFSISFPDFLPELSKEKRIQQIDDWHIRFHKFTLSGSEAFTANTNQLAAALPHGKQSVYLFLLRDLNGLSWYLDDLKSYLKSNSGKIFTDFYNNNPKNRFNLLRSPSTVLNNDLFQLKADRQKIDDSLVLRRHLFEHAVLSYIK
jgi:hypothetical protein